MRWGAASTSTRRFAGCGRCTRSSRCWARKSSRSLSMDCPAARRHVGHRFHHPGPITIGGAHDYVEKLRACHVIVDQEEREATIRDGAAEAAKEAGLRAGRGRGTGGRKCRPDRMPVPLLGSFDPAFLDVPEEVIQLTAAHQPEIFRDARTGRGSSRRTSFASPTSTPMTAVRRSSPAIERVLAARLADARFFWEHDLKVPLEEQARKLDGIVFHEKLGRSPTRSSAWRSWPGGWSRRASSRAPTRSGRTRRAAGQGRSRHRHGRRVPRAAGRDRRLSRRAQGEPDAVADAIRDHYKPVGQGDEVPTAPVTVAVSLADKLDTLCAFFGLDMKPTGSKDPFALRRAAIGLHRASLSATAMRLALTQAVRGSLSLRAGQSA